MNILKNFLKKQTGFSIVEAMVALAALSAGIFATMQTVQYVSNQATRTENQSDFEEFVFAIDNYVNSSKVCTDHFLNNPINTPIQKLYEPEYYGNESHIVYRIGSIAGSTFPYLNGKAEIESMQVVKPDPSLPGAAFQIVLKRKERANSTSFTTYTRTIPLIHELSDGIPQIDKCYETNSSLFDLSREVAKRMCQGAGDGLSPAGFHNGVFDAINGVCFFYGVENTMTPCPDGQAIRSIDFSSPYFVPVCGPILTPNLCPGGWIKSIDSNGGTTCLASLDELLPSPNDPVYFPTGLTRNCGLEIDTSTNPQKIKFGCDGPIPTPTPTPSPTPTSCTPFPTCAVIKSYTCANVFAGSDSCGTHCGMGSKITGCVKCQLSRCHLGNAYSVTCYLNGTHSATMVQDSIEDLGNGYCDTHDDGGAFAIACSSSPQCN